LSITRAKTSSIAQGPSTNRNLLAGNPVILPGSYESIATVNVTSTQSFIEFTGIAGTYSHLQLRILQRSTTPNNTNMTFNSDTGSNYNWHELFGDGSTAASASSSGSVTFMKASYLESVTAGYVGASVIDVLDYSNTSKNKTMRALTGSDANGTGYILLRSGLWRNTAAITTIRLTPASGSWDNNAQIALYGIK
jgi:hypothetical protein